jgi:hypothetical protein
MLRTPSITFALEILNHWQTVREHSADNLERYNAGQEESPKTRDQRGWFTSSPRAGLSSDVARQKLRETLGVHTCDRRSTKTYLSETFQDFRFEKGFTEDDELWVPDVRESNAERALRLGEALRDIVKNDESTYITISAHSGAITSILEVIGHRTFRLQTGGIIPVVVKVERC